MLTRSPAPATLVQSPSGGSAPESLPRAWFATPLPWLLAEGATEWVARAGASLGEPQPFDEGGGGRPERTRSVLSAEIASGLGSRVEGSIRFGAQQTGGGEDSDGVVADDVDLRIGWAPGAARPRAADLAAWLQVKIPTGPEKGGASTDETDVGAGASVGGHAGPASLFAHAGLILLGNPLRNGAQDDVAAWGAGVWWPGGARCSVTGEIEGRAGSRFGNSHARARAGLRWSGSRTHGGGISAGGALWHGLTGDAATWGFEIVASFTTSPR